MELDFGDELDSGGSGTPGVTSFAARSFLVVPEPLPRDALVEEPNCVSQPHQAVRTWCGYADAETGVRSTYADLDGNLPPDTPLVTQDWDPMRAEATSSISGGGTVFDALGRPVRLALHFRHVAPAAWHYYLLVHGSESVSVHHHGTLQLNANGHSFTFDAIPPLRLQIADGSKGPALSIYIPSCYSLTSYTGRTRASVWADGVRGSVDYQRRATTTGAPHATVTSS